MNDSPNLQYGNPDLARLYVARRNPPVVNNFSLGKLILECPDCKALRFVDEKRNCCHNGKVSLQALGECPDDLKDLYLGSNVRSRNFQENIRKYNSAMAFASFDFLYTPKNVPLFLVINMLNVKLVVLFGLKINLIFSQGPH